MPQLRYIFVIVCLLFTASSSYAITPEKEHDLRRLMELLNISAMPEQMAEMMVMNVIAEERKRYPNMAKNVEHAISTVVRDVVLREAPKLFNRLVPLYDKYYTHSEIKKLIDFFESPIGRKYSSLVQPMMQDMMRIAQEWGRDLGPLLIREVDKKLNTLSISNSSNMKLVTVFTTIQDAEGVTQKDLDNAALKKLEAWVVKTMTQKIINGHANKGSKEKSFKPKMISNSVYVTAGGKKLAIIKVNSNNAMRTVTIMGIKGDDLHRVACIRPSNHDIPVWSGKCGKKVEEIFGVSIKQ